MLRRLKFIQYFLLTLALWFAIRLVDDYTVNLDVPVTYTNIPSQLKLTRELPDRLHLTVKGKGQDLLLPYLGLYTDTVEVGLEDAVRQSVLDTRKLGEPFKLQFPQSYSIIAIKPDTIPIYFVEKIDKRVPVIPRITLETDAGYFLSQQIALEPDSINLVGAESDMHAINSWPTLQYTLSEVHRSGNIVIPLKESNNLVVNPQQVKVSYNVERYTEVSRKLPLHISDLSPNEHVRLLPSEVTVRYLVPLDRYEELKDIPIKLVIPRHALEKEAQFVSPTISLLPDEVQRVKISPSYVRFVRRQGLR